MGLSCHRHFSLVGFVRCTERNKMNSCFLIMALLLPAIDVETLTAELHVETGMAYISQGLTERALREFTSALDISDGAYEAHLGLARIAAINYSWTTAEEEYLIFMELRPNDYRAPLELAEILLAVRGRSDAALGYAEAALALAPLNGQCWMTLGRAEERIGNYEEAFAWYTRIIIEDPELADEARIRMASLLFQQGDLLSARDILLPAAASSMAEAHHFLALIYMEQNDNLRATDSINRYLYIEPNGLWADSARECLDELSSGNLLNN